MSDIVRICKKHGKLTLEDCFRDNSRKTLRCRECAKEYRDKKKIAIEDYYDNRDKEIDEIRWATINNVFK